MSMNQEHIAPAWLDPQRLTGPEWRVRNESGQVAGFILGHRNGRSIGSMHGGHCLSVVATGGGVGASLLLPSLLHYEGSMLILDAGGQLARTTAQARRTLGQSVVVQDPFGISGELAGGYNPLVALDPMSSTVVEDAALLAEALIVEHARDPHWTIAARALLQAVILWTLLQPAEQRNLPALAQMLAGANQKIRDAARVFGCEPQDALVQLLRTCTAFDGIIASVGVTLAAASERERAAIFATAIFQLRFLQSPSLRATLTTSDFDLGDLKTRAMTLYLCLPTSRMATHARWLRMMVTLALAAFEGTKTPRIPVLLVLNDIAALDRIEALETALASLPDQGVRVWLLMQSLAQLQARYPTTWHAFVATAGVMTFCSNPDQETLGFLATRTGASPSELRHLLETPSQRCLVLASGHAPVLLDRHSADAPLKA